MDGSAPEQSPEGATSQDQRSSEDDESDQDYVCTCYLLKN